MERDPVCGQVIKLLEMKDSSVYKGTRYYFCCPICKKLFVNNPIAYADKIEKDPQKITSVQLHLFNGVA